MRSRGWSAACAALVLGAIPAAHAQQQQQWQSDGQGGWFDQNNCHYAVSGGQYVGDYCLSYSPDGGQVTQLVPANGQWQPRLTMTLNDPQWYVVRFAANGQQLALKRADPRQVYVLQNGAWAPVAPRLAPSLPKNFDPSVTDPAGQAMFGQVGNQLSSMNRAWTLPDEHPDDYSHHH